MKQTTHEHNFPNLIVNTSSTTSEYLVFDYKCNIKKMKDLGFLFFSEENQSVMTGIRKLQIKS